ncbi:MAG: hypothetical protein NVS3B26_23320 [Mycobacteriales bacterium]
MPAIEKKPGGQPVTPVIRVPASVNAALKRTRRTEFAPDAGDITVTKTAEATAANTGRIILDTNRPPKPHPSDKCDS